MVLPWAAAPVVFEFDDDVDEEVDVDDVADAGVEGLVPQPANVAAITMTKQIFTVNSPAFKSS